MVILGLTDVRGVAAVLAVAGIVCCAAGIAGDMMQDLKVGHILGGTPYKMQIGEIIGVIFAALILTFPLMALHRAYEIGSAALPAPQAGLMALMAQGIVAGEMAWPLVIAGMFLAVGLIVTSFGSAALQYPQEWAGALILLIESAATLSIAAALSLAYVGGRPEHWEGSTASHGPRHERGSA